MKNISRMNCKTNQFCLKKRGDENAEEVTRSCKSKSEVIITLADKQLYTYLDTLAGYRFVSRSPNHYRTDHHIEVLGLYMFYNVIRF